MKKLQLDPNNLRVETFETSRGTECVRGTVRANVDTDFCTPNFNPNSFHCALSMPTACTCDPESNDQCSYACPNPTTMVAY
jgi:hypothetical protein